VDSEIVDALVYHLRQIRGTLPLGEEVESLELAEDGRGERAPIRLASGKKVAADRVLAFSQIIGRLG